MGGRFYWTPDASDSGVGTNHAVTEASVHSHPAGIRGLGLGNSAGGWSRRGRYRCDRRVHRARSRFFERHLDLVNVQGAAWMAGCHARVIWSTGLDCSGVLEG